MRIIYGVSGEGFGHSSRAKEILPFLLKRKHRILVVTYGQAYEVLKNYSGIDVLKVEGIELFFKEGKGLSLTKTVFNNLKKIEGNIKNFDEIMKRVRKFEPQLAISDMEPMVPIIRHLLKIPLICFDNQHRLTHLKLNVPKKYKTEYNLAKYFVRKTVSRADYYVILSFAKGKPVKDMKKVYVADPILRDKITKLKIEERNFILVYLTKKDEKILNILRKLDENFVVYGYDIDKQEGNIRFKKAGEGFLDDLRRCLGIIASAGFTLMSEAIYLKKPYYAIPLKGQFEQTLNALFLKQEKLGDFSEDPKIEDIRRFLNKLKGYKVELRNYKINPRDAVDALDKAIKLFG
ncbi:MAG: glycosyltransferase family protein [Nanoarchaeota archaeon]